MSVCYCPKFVTTFFFILPFYILFFFISSFNCCLDMTSWSSFLSIPNRVNLSIFKCCSITSVCFFDWSCQVESQLLLAYYMSGFPLNCEYQWHFIHVYLYVSLLSPRIEVQWIFIYLYFGWIEINFNILRENGCSKLHPGGVVFPIASVLMFSFTITLNYKWSHLFPDAITPCLFHFFDTTGIFIIGGIFFLSIWIISSFRRIF